MVFFSIIKMLSTSTAYNMFRKIYTYFGSAFFDVIKSSPSFRVSHRVSQVPCGELTLKDMFQLKRYQTT